MTNKLLDARYLFNSTRFLNHQGTPIIIEKQSGISTAKLAWFESQGDGFSPLKAPFGSIDILGPFSNSLLYNLLEEFVKDAENRKIRNFKITQPPDGYDPELNQRISKALQQFGFQILHQDLNFHLEVNFEFKLHLHRSERWKLNKSRRNGLYFEKIGMEEWINAFQLLETSRKRKGYPLSMTQNAIENTFSKFPDLYNLFGVKRDNQLIAMAITITINPKIQYVFYTADAIEFRKFSPVVMLHEGIYQFCQTNNIKLLDLGTASVNGVVNSGVSTFKRNLGGIASLKNTFKIRF